MNRAQQIVNRLLEADMEDLNNQEDLNSQDDLSPENVMGAAGGIHPRIAITYYIITPESAEQGDYSETGWEDEEGVSMEPDEWDLEEGLNEVSLAVKFLKDKGAHPSSSHFHPGVWYIETGEADYRSGETTEHGFHLKDFTEEQERQIFDQMTRR